MLLRQHTAAGKHTPLQPFNTIAISLMTLGWKAALGLSELHVPCIKIKQTAHLLQTVVFKSNLFHRQRKPIIATNILCKCNVSADFSLSWAYDNLSNMHCLLPFPFIDVCSFSEALPLPMDIPPLIRPVLPSPLKHDGTRRAAVTQWDFFIEQWTSTFAHTQTKTHTETDIWWSRHMIGHTVMPLFEYPGVI